MLNTESFLISSKQMNRKLIYVSNTATIRKRKRTIKLVKLVAKNFHVKRTRMQNGSIVSRLCETHFCIFNDEKRTFYEKRRGFFFLKPSSASNLGRNTFQNHWIFAVFLLCFENDCIENSYQDLQNCPEAICEHSIHQGS